MIEILTSIKRDILQDRMAGYRNAYYAHGVDARIGKEIDDERMIEAAKDNMRKAQQCLDALERMLNELESDGQDHSD